MFTTVDTVKKNASGPLGPTPVRGPDAQGRISGQRAFVLELLQQQKAPVTIAAVAGEFGVHQNTAREHLEALVERGLAVRAQQTGRGRGRPAWVYAAAVDHVEPDQRLRDYTGLATALASHLTLTSNDPATEAVQAGRVWGRELVAGTPVAASRATATKARQRVVELLRDLGFDPVADQSVRSVMLRRCPLLDAAKRYPQVVCQVHLGIVRGAMDVLGGNAERTAIMPFAEPGACRLQLQTP